METVTRPRGRPFAPGQSGNPGGRPRGLVRRIREQTRDGDELADYMLRVFRDEDATRRDRMEAATWLADRGFGKPTQTTATVTAPELTDLSDLTKLSDAELEALVRQFEEHDPSEGIELASELIAVDGEGQPIS